MKLNFILVLSFFFIFQNVTVKSQVQFILNNEKSISGIPKYNKISDSIKIQKFDLKFETVLKKDILYQNEVRLNIVTNKEVFKNIKNLKIVDSTFIFQKRQKNILIHKDSIIEIIEFIKPRVIDIIDNTNKINLGIGLGFPFGLILSYDKTLNTNRGFKFNLGVSENPSFIIDYYFRYLINENFEHNLSFSSGLYFTGDIDYVHSRNSGIRFLLGSSYDLKFSFLILRAGFIFAPMEPKYKLLPNISAGINIEI